MDYRYIGHSKNLTTSVGFIFLTRKKGQVVLYPKRTRFRKYQKGRFKSCKTDGTQLCFEKYDMKS